MSKFEEWHSKTYHPDYGKEHREWEEKAWNAAIDEVNHIVCKHYNDDDLLKRIRELKE